MSCICLYYNRYIGWVHMVLCTADFTLILTLAIQLPYFLPLVGWTFLLALLLNRLCEIAYYTCIASTRPISYTVLQFVFFSFALVLSNTHRELLGLLTVWEFIVLIIVCKLVPVFIFPQNYRHAPSRRTVSTATTRRLPIVDCQAVVFRDPNGKTHMGLCVVDKEYADQAYSLMAEVSDSKDDIGLLDV